MILLSYTNTVIQFINVTEEGNMDKINVNSYHFVSVLMK